MCGNCDNKILEISTEKAPLETALLQELLNTPYILGLGKIKGGGGDTTSTCSF